MKARVVTDAIVGGGYFLLFGDQIELESLGEYAEAMINSSAVEVVEAAVFLEPAKPFPKVELH